MADWVVFFWSLAELAKEYPAPYGKSTDMRWYEVAQVWFVLVLSGWLLRFTWIGEMASHNIPKLPEHPGPP